MLLEEKIKFIKQELEEICRAEVLVMCGVRGDGYYVAEVDYEDNSDGVLDSESNVSIEDALSKVFDRARKIWEA